ncbi:GAF domain-containing protein [Alteromonas sp. ASW11-19]|uniref:GAF domain-containing protein n=1 Tax=Alteromonas salexigens TaxID=2982530 RepID=A0ABT2VL93_9ALTE|nr:GAF domain-containing protein [Alteromonas salexigens]MCU7553031.1 GAF domain-containing protein [Alteromonas salexigens]
MMQPQSASEAADELIANCEQEQLHLSGHIQSFGVLLVVGSDNLTITHVSANAASLFGNRPLLGEALTDISAFPTELLEKLDGKTGNRENIFNFRLDEQSVHLRLLQGDGCYLLELEPTNDDAPVWSLAELRTMVYPTAGQQWEHQDYWKSLLTAIASVLPFHRLLLYRFDSDWSGEVVAEHSQDNNQQYLGLKFPASDIPAIARKLYFENPSRLISNITEEPVAVHSLSDEIPNLTWSDLRSVSPVHAQYLKNMGIQTSYSVPIILSGKLWGIVSCHHREPLHVDARSRYQSEQLVQHFCSVYAMYLSRKKLELLKAIDEKIKSLVAQLDILEDTRAALEAMLDATAQVCNGTLAAATVSGEWLTSDDTADISLLKKIDKVFARDTSDHVLHCQNIQSLPELADVEDPALRGVLAIKLDHGRDTARLYVFRPPEKQLTEWAGNPDKTQAQSETNDTLSPRTSFAKWSEIKGDLALPWSKADLLFAKKARVGLLRLFHRMRKLQF